MLLRELPFLLPSVSPLFFLLASPALFSLPPALSLFVSPFPPLRLLDGEPRRTGQLQPPAYPGPGSFNWPPAGPLIGSGRASKSTKGARSQACLGRSVTTRASPTTTSLASSHIGDALGSIFPWWPFWGLCFPTISLWQPSRALFRSTVSATPVAFAGEWWC